MQYVTDDSMTPTEQNEILDRRQKLSAVYHVGGGNAESFDLFCSYASTRSDLPEDPFELLDAMRSQSNAYLFFDDLYEARKNRALSPEIKPGGKIPVVSPSELQDAKAMKSKFGDGWFDLIATGKIKVRGEKPIGRPRLAMTEAQAAAKNRTRKVLNQPPLVEGQDYVLA